MDEHFRQNLRHAMHMRFGPGHRDKHLAAALRVDRSTINRLRHSATPPTQERLDALSRLFNVPAQAWRQPPDLFAETLEAQTRKPPLREAGRAVAMSSIYAHRHLWAASFAIHGGQYLAWWKAHGIQDCYVGSLVEIGSLEAAGIQFRMLNPYITDDVERDEIRCWRYEGVVYPVADYLYFYGEQTDSSYELFTMIMTASPLCPPDLLRGCLSGIYVKDGRKQIAVNVAVVFLYLPEPLGDWRDEIGRRLGKVPASRVPDRIRRILDPYPGVIPVA